MRDLRSFTPARRGLKRGTLGGRSPEALALLNPQLPLLVRALGSRSAAVVSLALRVLASLVQLPLKGALQGGRYLFI